MASPRTHRRDEFDHAGRLRLVEVDLDEHDELFDDLRAELGRIKGIMVGILVSTTTAALLLAVNLVVGV